MKWLRHPASSFTEGKKVSLCLSCLESTATAMQPLLPAQLTHGNRMTSSASKHKPLCSAATSGSRACHFSQPTPLFGWNSALVKVYFQTWSRKTLPHQRDFPESLSQGRKRVYFSWQKSSVPINFLRLDFRTLIASLGSLVLGSFLMVRFQVIF